MQDALSIPAGELEQIIAAHDGDVALLWLCLKRDPGATLEDAARLLCRTKAQMDEALEKLQRMGLAEKPPAPVKEQSAQSIKLPPADETPPYTVRDIAARSRSDPGDIDHIAGKIRRMCADDRTGLRTDQRFKITIINAALPIGFYEIERHPSLRLKPVERS